MRKIGVFIIFFIVSVVTYCVNFSVSPTKFEVDLSKNNIFEVHLLNNTSKPLRLEVYTEIPVGYEDSNLNDNIVIFPKKVSIKPGGKKEVRFKVEAIENKEKKNFKTLLVFRERLPNLIGESKKGNINMELGFITEIAIGVYGK
ncbi:hypothetical protein [uncultured Fusobacterium sp.]|uniref:hypothetical protein n=1 Tax=uncultured Fusobacterium sp. TaxID=159267 RepID=UPI0025FA5D65|nr:hypothetical protein [uncultured Fusobacterium sp.]